MNIPIPFWQAVLIIAVAAVCTQLTRAFPFLLFGGKKQIPRPVLYLGQMLPPAIIATLVVYCIKDAHFLAWPFALPELIGIAVVAALHLWRHNILLSIGAGTVFYMLLVQFVFV